MPTFASGAARAASHAHASACASSSRGDTAAKSFPHSMRDVGSPSARSTDAPARSSAASKRRCCGDSSTNPIQAMSRLATPGSPETTAAIASGARARSSAPSLRVSRSNASAQRTNAATSGPLASKPRQLAPPSPKACTRSHASAASAADVAASSSGASSRSAATMRCHRCAACRASSRCGGSGRPASSACCQSPATNAGHGNTRTAGHARAPEASIARSWLATISRASRLLGVTSVAPRAAAARTDSCMRRRGMGGPQCAPDPFGRAM